MEITSKGIIVVGAGAAGLAAARELRRTGREVLVVEARARAGGRLLTVRDSETAVPVELGAEFVHGVHPQLWAILHQMRAPVLELGGEHWARDDQGLHPAHDLWEESGRIFEAMSRAREQSFAEFVAGIRAPDKAKQSAASFVEGFNAARKELVSLEWLNAENSASDEVEGDRSFRVLSGYDSIAKYLAADLDIRFATEVTDIEWQPGDVRVNTADAQQFQASRAIIAVPFAILQQGRLRIHPEPAALAAARSAIVTGNAMRITYRFAQATWANFGPHISFIHGGGCFPVWWTAYPIQFPVITRWAAGPKADALAGASEAELKRMGLDSLRGILGEDPGEPENAWVHDWKKDAFALGAYSYVRVNGMAAHEEFRKIVENTICFAGEALATGHMGTVHGAIASGVEARPRTGANTFLICLPSGPGSRRCPVR